MKSPLKREGESEVKKFIPVQVANGVGISAAILIATAETVAVA